MLNCPIVEKGNEIAAAHSSIGWIFELDRRGTVLHSRAFPTTSSNPAASETFGFNIFEDFDGFEEMPTLKQCFRSFVAGNKATESFSFSSPGAGHTRILFTKAFQTGTLPPSPLVMMEIRKDQLTEHLGGYNGNTTFKLRK
jgi:hypothetical protein